MQEAEYELTQRALGDGQPAQANAGVIARFSLRPVQDAEATIAEGRPIFKDREFVSLQAVGDRGNVVERPVRPGDKFRFAQLYDQFKRQQEQVDEGTPLAEWPLVTRSQVEELKYFKIHTVEQLAAVSDSTGQKFMGFLGLQQKAKAYLEAAKGNAPLVRMQEELKERDDKIAVLERQLQEVVEDLKKSKKEK